MKYFIFKSLFIQVLFKCTGSEIVPEMTYEVSSGTLNSAHSQVQNR